ncbi:MAG: restriction endonuclease, partial [Verrucomicrobia bacterium]|nr:restriction endonuclease [Verrucomicrobiota bacterium]
YTRKNVLTNYSSLDAFLSSWKDADKKRAIVEELENHGVIFSALQDEVGCDFDPFDLICHVAYEQKPLTRRERAETVRKQDYFTKYGELARQVLDSLLEKYADDGLLDLEDMAIITLDPIKQLGTAPEIVKAFGGKPAYDEAIRELTSHLYEVA